MYRMPSEFLRAKNTVIGPITADMMLGTIGGFVIGTILQEIGLPGSNVLTAVLVGSGLAVTALKFKGLPLYKFGVLYIEYLTRYFGGRGITPPEIDDEIQTVDIAVYDEQGEAIIFAETD